MSGIEKGEGQRLSPEEWERQEYLSHFRGVLKPGDHVVESADGVTGFPGFADDPEAQARLQERMRKVFEGSDDLRRGDESIEADTSLS